MTLDLYTAARLVGPGMARTFVAQIRRKASSNGQENAPIDNDKELIPPDEAVYNESVRLMRQMMTLVCVSAVEDMHAITTRHNPAPPSVRVVHVSVPARYLDLAAELVRKQLGPHLDCVGRTWWQWREPGGEAVKVQWVEMKSDYQERVRTGDEGKKVLFYVHGGGYYLGGYGHDVQIQRHARKLKGRCFAPSYRLAPEFPFPCAIQDIVSAYLYLLTTVQPEHIVLAGDSAGGGLCLALLLIIRDQNLPMPAGASLISPWVDLTHSFPSITAPTAFDYVPSTGFHSKPSLSWPPPSRDERRALGIPENPLLPPDHVITIDGQPTTITDQIQMYAPNAYLAYPLVSPVHAATLGGLCPVQVVVGGAEILRDEQMFLAHKMASPEWFPLSDMSVKLNGEKRADISKFPSTEVELLVFDDGPHAAPTLGHTDIAKFEYRAVAQFAAWALAKAGGDKGTAARRNSFASSPVSNGGKTVGSTSEKVYVGLVAGDALPPLENHMRRYRVDRLGRLYQLEAPHLIPALSVSIEQVGGSSGEALKGWLQVKKNLEIKFASEKEKVFKKRQEHARKGYLPVANGEIPPPSALVGRRVVDGSHTEMGSSGVGNSLLSKFFRKMEKGEPLVEP